MAGWSGGILAASKEHGAAFARYSMVRLPGNVAEVFASWLERHFPDRKEKILNRIRAAHQGRLNSTVAGVRMRGAGEAADQLHALFHASCRRLGLSTAPSHLSLASFRRVMRGGQGELF